MCIVGSAMRRNHSPPCCNAFVRFSGGSLSTRGCTSSRTRKRRPREGSFRGRECGENILVRGLIADDAEESHDAIETAVEPQVADVVMPKRQPVAEMRRQQRLLFLRPRQHLGAAVDAENRIAASCEFDRMPAGAAV
jgi:hypothetical protein